MLLVYVHWQQYWLTCANRYHDADILRALDHQLDASWRVFGTFLSVEYGTMNSIDADQRGKSAMCMLDLVSKWVTHQEGTGDLPRTWRSVVEAVRDTGSEQLATDLAEKYRVTLSQSWQLTCIPVMWRWQSREYIVVHFALLLLLHIFDIFVHIFMLPHHMLTAVSGSRTVCTAAVWLHLLHMHPVHMALYPTDCYCHNVVFGQRNMCMNVDFVYYVIYSWKESFVAT